MAQRVPVSEAGTKTASSARVRVAVRLRPYINQQDEKGEGPCVRGTGPQTLEITNWRNATETLQYQFDVFHGEKTTQREVFVASVKPILIHVLKGQNASVFAYGPTGAGKTHTMLGSRSDPGVIPRAVQEVIRQVKVKQKAEDGWDYTVAMSYLEIYNEKVLDLLSPKPSTQDLAIREDKDRNIVVPGLTEVPLSTSAEFDSHFVPASLNRTTASTKLNHRSSRSHAILLIKVVRTQRVPPCRCQTGKLYLVDLAGSEDSRRTGNEGIRLKESGAINRSLFNLSKVVDSLNAPGGGRVPYRDSKLTRLLQDSLGGSAHSVMITNIAPEYHYYFPTFNALNFATKSKQIINKPFVRETVTQETLKVAGKRPREETSSTSSTGNPPKKLKERTKSNEAVASLSPDAHSISLLHSRLTALEKNLKNMASNIQDGQQQKAVLSSREAEPLFNKTNLPPLHRKPSVAGKPRKQQAVVQPLQGSSPQLLGNSLQIKQEKSPLNCSEGKAPGLQLSPLCEKENMRENLGPSSMAWCRSNILQVLNTGSLKELKGLQSIGDKKAKLIMGWREMYGHFSQVEDLMKIEGIGAKRFDSFMKVNYISMNAELKSSPK